tara:strand:- start:520 stop:771 length:252 start_codon:yes stop_codon:yes gene_type:complete
MGVSCNRQEDTGAATELSFSFCCDTPSSQLFSRVCSLLICSKLMVCANQEAKMKKEDTDDLEARKIQIETKMNILIIKVIDLY